MKKIISFLIVIVMMISACVGITADEVGGNTYVFDNVTVVFDENSQFSNEKQEAIANLIVKPEYGVSATGLMCTLFGHKNTSETVVTITHRYNVESPRCLQEFFIVTTCSRCDETSVERTGFNYITCCPVD